MLSSKRPKERGSSRKVTPPSATTMSNDQFAAYLAQLRDNRMNRPGGARTQRQSSGEVSVRSSFGGRPSMESATQAAPLPVRQRVPSDGPSMTDRSTTSASMSSRYSYASGQARDYYPNRPARPLKPSEVVPSATYIERGQRWMEKEEAVSLRQAMQDMDIKNSPEPQGRQDEERLYEAALQEASELVWQHQNPDKVPTPGGPYRYKQHLRKNSYAHARTASVGRYGDDIVPTGLARDSSSRSVSGSSSGSEPYTSMRSRYSAGTASGGRGSLDQSRKSSGESKSSKSYGSLGGPPVSMNSHRRRSSLKRNISGEVQKPFSGDQIWEEPEGTTPQKSATATVVPSVDEVQPLRIKAKDPLNRVQFAPSPPDAGKPRERLSKFEIHRNPPTQSRNPQYTTNPEAEKAQPNPDSIPRKHGVEIRGEDIRDATSMRLRDRSPKLPTPTAVSDSPGRPIVSFDANWKAPEEATDPQPEEPLRRRVDPSFSSVPSPVEQDKQAQVIPIISVSDGDEAWSPHPPSRGNQPPRPPSIQISGDDSPSIPTISVSEASPAIPTIVLPDDSEEPSIPIIVTPDDAQPAAPSSCRPLPTPGKTQPRAAGRPRGHWSPAPAPAGSRATARCHECLQPIEGRFVALAGGRERFHPGCFRCYACGTSLEALEISPEPDAHRAARLERIARRAAGEVLDEVPGETMAEDGDDRLRFYCHLDWHEQFAPRCKHCRTPIVGEHVVALGEHWHYGHFFCAECGDPFEHGATHIEKDGYAWCVGCQTKRTERRAPKCRKCKTAVIGQYVVALGGEWHDECFRCRTCGGAFDDGQIFPCEDRETGDMAIYCTRCREMELKR